MGALLQPPPQPPLSRTTSSTLPTNLLNKYELGRMLGRGSFAKVYAARTLADNKLVAVKIIDKLRMGAFMEPRIICEISAMRRLQHHPNILKIHEVMATKTRIFIVMDLALGGELFTRVLQRGKLIESKARRYFQQLVSALRFCHENGVAHRDIKPQNLLLDADGNLKVSDFGLSALAEAHNWNVLHTACGTPAFTAPEVMARRGYDGSKADAWSCGVILFFLLSAKLPFDDSNITAMYKKIQRREYQMPSPISKSAKSIINQLLDPNPIARMSIEQLMNHSWFLKNYQLPTQSSMFHLERMKSCKKFDLSTINAFDIISLSAGLDLSGLFEVTHRKDKRFTSKETVEITMERVREVGGRLGYRVEEWKGGAIGLGKGRLVLMFELLVITEKLLMVEVRVVEGGGVDFDEVQWVELKDGLKDIVLQWHNEPSV